jgi:DNA-binding LacI/PurR family transcriptional regulator
VILGYAPSQYSVRSDDRSGGRMLVEHLLALGHRGIGLITAAEHVNYAVAQRVVGVREALSDAGIPLDESRIVYSDYSSEGGYQACQQLIAQHADLSAVICLNDRSAFGAIQQLSAIGRRVPDDVSVVGYDNIAASAQFTPHLTTIDQQASAQGLRAAQMLFDVLTGQISEPVVLPVELIVRGSTGALTSAL